MTKMTAVKKKSFTSN